MNHRGLVTAAAVVLSIGFSNNALAQVGSSTRQPVSAQPRYPQQSVPQGVASGRYPPAAAQPASAVAPVIQPRRGMAGQADRGVVTAASQAGASPYAPFQLTPAETALRDQVLRNWETESAKIITFKSTFDRWEYSEYGRGYIPEGPGFPQRRNSEVPWIKSRGHLAYAKPDKGSFKIEAIYHYQWDEANKKDTWSKLENEVGERWVCDGKFVYNYNHKETQMEVSSIPPELQGKAIVDGPLPFLFGAKAEKLKQRYWIRVSQSNGEEIWLDTYPKYQADAASYRRVEVILDSKTSTPKAMQVYLPNGDRAVYMFDKPAVNNQLDRLFGVFKPPRTPFGWKRVMLDTPQRANQAQNPHQAPTRGTRFPTPRTRY